MDLQGYKIIGLEKFTTIIGKTISELSYHRRFFEHSNSKISDYNNFKIDFFKFDGDYNYGNLNIAYYCKCWYKSQKLAFILNCKDLDRYLNFLILKHRCKKNNFILSFWLETYQNKHVLSVYIFFNNLIYSKGNILYFEDANVYDMDYKFDNGIINLSLNKKNAVPNGEKYKNIIDEGIKNLLFGGKKSDLNEKNFIINPEEFIKNRLLKLDLHKLFAYVSGKSFFNIFDIFKTPGYKYDIFKISNYKNDIEIIIMN